MAEKAKKPAGTKKVVNKRSLEQLKQMGPKGALIVAAQRAFALAGSKTEGYKGLLGEYSPKSVNGVLYALTKPANKGGKILSLDESGATYDEIIGRAKAAKSSIVANEYNNQVESFIDSLVALEGSRGGGGKRSGAILEGFSFD